MGVGVTIFDNYPLFAKKGSTNESWAVQGYAYYTRWGENGSGPNFNAIVQ